ncbi:MAG: CAP domain-containing protein [Chitinophagaceae bacterium]
MRTLFLVASYFLIFAGASSFSVETHSSKAEPCFDSSQTVEEQILFYVNKYRESKSLPALQMNLVISDQAEKHSEEMADKKMAFGHDGFPDRVKNITAKLGSLHASAENVAYGELSPEEVVALWIKSPGHRKNIEGNYTLTGIGTAKAKDGVIFFTQIFSIR